MKKAPLFTMLILLLFAATACGSGSPATNSFGNGGNSANGFRSNSRSTTPLSPEAKLALGTIKLEGTQRAVDPKMATKLIPLWQLLVQLNSSSSSAPQEVIAVVDQIKSTMTPDQVKTINGMTLSQADMFTVFQEQAQASGSGGTTNASGNGFSSRNRGGDGGGFVFIGGGGPGAVPGGGGPGGGFAGGGFRNNSATGSGTSTPTDSAQAAQAAQARENAISSLLINQLIKLLQTKLGS